MDTPVPPALRRKNMAIPKKIHYCWFGGNPLPDSAKKCIKSWKKYCPDYEIVEWNESNFDLNCNTYCAEMAKRKKWAFLTDYVRLKVVYEQGGVYLDTDVQVIRPLDELVRRGPYMGFENTGRVATGLGFAAEAGNPLIRENMAYYEELQDFSELKSCPFITSEVLTRHGLTEDVTAIQNVEGLTVYPEEYLCPKNERTGLTKITKNTYSIHQFDASWFEPSWKEGQKKRWREAKLQYWLHTPNRALRKLLGTAGYEKLKGMLRK